MAKYNRNRKGKRRWFVNVGDPAYSSKESGWKNPNDLPKAEK